MWPFSRKPKPSIVPVEGHVLSILSPEEVAALGELPAQAIAGHGGIVGDRVESFRPNPGFIEFMHSTIQRCVADDVDLQDAARRQNEGHVYILDGRTPEPEGHVPPEDIIGAVQVRNGEIVPGSYKANPNYRVYTDRGLVRLPRSLHQALLRALKEAG